jgi:hypothetical protein
MPRPTYLQRIAGVEPGSRVLSPPHGVFPPMPVAATTGAEEMPTERPPLAPTIPARSTRVAESKPAAPSQMDRDPAVGGVELDAKPPRVASVVEPSVPAAALPEPAPQSSLAAPVGPTLWPVEVPPREGKPSVALVPVIDRRAEEDETSMVHHPETTGSRPRPAVAALVPAVPPDPIPSVPRLPPADAAPVAVIPATRSPDTEAPLVSDKPAESPPRPRPVPDVVPPIRLEPSPVTPPLPRPDSGGENAKVRIGSLEVRITAPAVPTPASPPAAPVPARREATRPATGLARGFRSFGLRQG